MRSRIFAVLAIAILAGGGLAYGTYNVINSQPVPPPRPRRHSLSSSPPRICRSAPRSRRTMSGS